MDYLFISADDYDAAAMKAYHALKIFTLRVSTTKKYRLFTRKIEEQYQESGIKENVRKKNMAI